MAFANFLEDVWALDKNRPSRKHIRPLVVQHASLEGPIIHQMTDVLNPEVTRGFWLPKIENGQRKNYIVTARDMNQCWTRFIYIKELMHAFDAEDERVTNRSDLEDVAGLGFGSSGDKPVIRSEIRALYRTALVCCNFKARAGFMNRYNSRTTTAHQIAEELRVPEHYVTLLILGSRYDTALQFECPDLADKVLQGSRL